MIHATDRGKRSVSFPTKPTKSLRRRATRSKMTGFWCSMPLREAICKRRSMAKFRTSSLQSVTNHNRVTERPRRDSGAIESKELNHEPGTAVQLAESNKGDEGEALGFIALADLSALTFFGEATRCGCCPRFNAL